MAFRKASAEAAFARGETGVDGQATEEVKDAAETERDQAREQLLRGKTYLGREFLTWMLWRSEAGEPLLDWEGAPVVPLFVGRVTLKGIHGDVTELMAKGALAPYSEQVRHALQRGLLVHASRVRITHGERAFEASLDAEFLDVKSASLPALLTEEEDDRASERLMLTEQLSSLVEALVQAFLTARTSARWRSHTVREMRAWMEGETQLPGVTPLRRAARAVG